ncbi:uncharacterized protein LOC129235814 [Anastrepha obliqua]|uniref:uncharacterized protein LOC129235814 n=1 Tax=Anastrepha obliqua TaxID=95512 RepID=UPI0024098E03|nr:uncharacterized protein LOC129235814 [Anastrepha obliqua]XP_054725830.1 uncharacterized protein LOC129235814 [Anastrepha obliqua]
MLTSCLAIASTVEISIKSPSDVFATINGNLNDESCATSPIADALDTKSYTSMTKQLTSSSSTTNPNCALPSSAANSAGSVGTLILSPLSSPAANVGLAHTQPDVNVVEADGCKDAKILQKSTSNCNTLVPNSLAAGTLSAIGSVNDVASSAKAGSDASGRSAALERAYVHDVYEHCEEPTGLIRPRIAQFLNNLEPGAVVCDVGCGSGRYLTHGNPAICTVGVDRCHRLSKVAREKGGEVMMGDNLELPFRDESFDAVLSLAVVHHFATTERRVSALRELARILRIGGRVIITVWALEQRHRRFESQDVLIPWQPPKIRNLSCSDEEDDDSFLPPYHAYTEDSTNSSRSAGDGDSSSLSSSSPGESCYSFVRRAIQKLASGRRHPWFLDSWTSKETKNDSSLDFEDVKDLPIELRRLEDFEDFHDPPLSAGLKSRSLGSILNPPPRQIVRSRSSVPSLGGTILHVDVSQKPGTSAATYSLQNALQAMDNCNAATGIGTTNNVSPTKLIKASNVKSLNSNNSLGRRPKLIKQKQSLCDEEYQLPEHPFHMISTYNSNNNSVSSNLYLRSGCYYNSNNGNVNSHTGGAAANLQNLQHQSSLTARQMVQASIFLRKQSSLNEELMAVNRLREKERVRKRIQKQTSLNEAFLCRSAMFSKKLHVIRESFTKKMKTSTGSFERATKTGLNKLVQNLTSYITPEATSSVPSERTVGETGLNSTAQQPANAPKCNKYHHHHHHHHHYVQQQLQQQQSLNPQNYHRQQGASMHALEKGSPSTNLQKQLSLGGNVNKYAGPVTYCNSAECTTSACYCSTYHYTGCNTFCTTNDCHENKEEKARRHSRESGSDSSKDSSLQSDTSIESEDSFASVIFIPKPEQHQQQLNYQQQHQSSNSSSSNSSSINGGDSGSGGGCHAYGNCCQQNNGNCKIQSNGNPASCITCLKHQPHSHQQRLPSVPTSPLIMPCPPTPAHSPAAIQAVVTSPPRTVAAVTAAMAILTPPSNNVCDAKESLNSKIYAKNNAETAENRFNFDEAHIKKHENYKEEQKEKNDKAAQKNEVAAKITKQIIKNLPPIPKFRKQQSLQAIRQNFPIVRRCSATSTSSIPSIPKLMSLELFNPATDDLDSDSSEASTPNSIDSVISTGKSNTTAISSEQTHMKTSPTSDQCEELDLNKSEEPESEQIAKGKKQQYCPADLQIDSAFPHNIFLNEEDSCPIPPAQGGVNANVISVAKKEQDFAEFAEQLNVQLLRKIEDKNGSDECATSEVNSETGDNLDTHISASAESLNKKRNNELRDLSSIREELRERRLMLANLSTQPSLQQSPTSSTSSLSSQTRSFTIHEENEEESDERSYSLQLYENCKISKINYKRNRPYNLNPETAYLLQDEGDIFEEEEELDVLPVQAEHQETRSQLKYQSQINARPSKNTIRVDSGESGIAAEKEENTNKEKDKDMEKQKLLHNRQSTESWGNSNSSTGSLESPSQGGATTHHRYYHVFREGELDALINHHVTSLHIVSSYYERASWCVVAEKVQVWTI